MYHVCLCHASAVWQQGVEHATKDGEEGPSQLFVKQTNTSQEPPPHLREAIHFTLRGPWPFRRVVFRMAVFIEGIFGTITMSPRMEQWRGGLEQKMSTHVALPLRRAKGAIIHFPWQ